MEPNKPKEHRPWEPRIDRERELNPSVRTTLPEAEIDSDDRTLEDMETEADESEARDDDPDPIKINR
jgi:hypothetical protein